MAGYTTVYPAVYPPAAVTPLFLSYDPVLSRVVVDLTEVRSLLGADDTGAVQRSLNGTTWVTVRGASDVTISSTATPASDYEFTPDVINYYRVVSVSSGTATDIVIPDLNGMPWLKNLRFPFLNMPVKLSDAGDITRAANGTTFLPLGHAFPVAVPVVRNARQFTLTVETDTDDATAGLGALLSTGDVVFLQVPGAYPVQVGGYYYVGDTTETRNGVPWSMRWIDLALTEAVPPSPEVTPITSTWASVVSDFATWADVPTGLGSWADVVSLVGAPGDVVTA